MTRSHKSVETTKSLIALIVGLTLCGMVEACAQRQRSTQTDALFRAATEGNTDMVRSLLSSPGADVNATDERGSTPLLEAARFGHDDICRLLIASGADFKARDREGKTALKLAIEGNHDDVVRVLKQAGETE